MERARPDPSVPPGPRAAGTLDGHGTSLGPAPAGLSDEPAARRGIRVWHPPLRLPGSARLRALETSRPVAVQLLMLLVFAAAGIAATWPRVTYLAGLLPSDRDSSSYVWGFWWVTHQLIHLGNPWFTSYMAAPAGVQIGFHTLMPLPGLLMTPVTLTLGPSVSYNLLVVLTPGLLCFAMWRLARLWLPSAPGRIAAAVFFGLSSMLTEQAWYHLNIALGAMFLPMALEASVRLRRTPGIRQGVILGLVMGAAVLTDQESAVLAAIITGLALLPWLLRRPAPGRLRPALLAVGVGAVVASPQIIAMVQEVLQGGLAIPTRILAVSYKHYGIGLPGMFSPTPRVADFGLTALAAPFMHSRDNEAMPMFGSVLTLLAILGLAAAWRRRSARLLGLLWLGTAALAFGTTIWIGQHQYIPLMSWWHGVRVSDIMPYTWFVRIPGLSSFREADRLAILGMVPAALLAGAAVNWLRYHARPLIALVVVLAVLEAGYSGSKWLSGKPRVGTIPASFTAVDRGIAADRTKSVVVDLPFGIRGGIPVYGLAFDPRALVMATADGHPRAIGYVSRLPIPTRNAIDAHPFYHYLVTVQHGLRVSPAHLLAARRDLRHLHVGWVVVWRRDPNVQHKVLPFLRAVGFRFSYRAGSVLVYRPGGR